MDDLREAADEEDGPYPTDPPKTLAELTGAPDPDDISDGKFLHLGLLRTARLSPRNSDYLVRSIDHSSVTRQLRVLAEKSLRIVLRVECVQDATSTGRQVPPYGAEHPLHFLVCLQGLQDAERSDHKIKLHGQGKIRNIAQFRAGRVRRHAARA